MGFLWGVTLAGSVLGGIMFLLSLVMGRNAPDDLAAAAVAFAVIPYVFTRACERLSLGDWQHRLIHAVAELERRMPRGPMAVPAARAAARPFEPDHAEGTSALDRLAASGFKLKDLKA